MAEVVTDFKKYIERLVKKIHLEQMSPDVRARFKTYTDNKDFIGHMKDWANDLAADIVLDDNSYESAHKAFAAVFESMSRDSSSLKGTTKEIFNRYFGDSNVFSHPEPVSPRVGDQLDDFATKVLTDENETYLTSAIANNTWVMHGKEFDHKAYKAFQEGVRDKKYETDAEFRDQLLSIIGFIKSAQSMGSHIFPEGSVADKYAFNGFGLPEDINAWFVVRDNPGFKFVMPVLVKQLTVDSKFREDFKKYDSAGIISSKVEKGLENTAYDNPKSDDFVPPVYKDEKNVFQKVGDGAHNFWDNTLRQFSDPFRGSRKYFSPYSQYIIKAFDGVKNKDGKRLRPVDGIKGIIENKDKILAKITEQSPNAKKHFEWFVQQMDTYSKKMPKAFDGALHNAKQMRAIVSRMIVDAVQAGKDEDIEAVKTSMEILSVMKYGIKHSRTTDIVNGTEFNVLGQTNMAKKYDALGFLAKSIDRTAKFGLVAAMRVGAAARNHYMRNHTKFNGKMGDIKAAHKDWQKAHSTESIDTTIRGYESGISDLKAKLGDARTPGPLKTREDRAEMYFNSAKDDLSQFEIDHAAEKANINVKKGELNLKQKALEDFIDQVDVELEIPERFAPGTDKFEMFLQTKDPAKFAQYEALKADIENAELAVSSLETPYNAEINRLQEAVGRTEGDYNAARSERETAERNLASLEAQKTALENERTAVQDGSEDKYLELMAYWDMLESFGKTHQFTLASKKMRNKFLEGHRDGTSKAQQVTSEFLADYMSRYGGGYSAAA